MTRVPWLEAQIYGSFRTSSPSTTGLYALRCMSDSKESQTLSMLFMTQPAREPPLHDYDCAGPEESKVLSISKVSMGIPKVA